MKHRVFFALLFFCTHPTLHAQEIIEPINSGSVTSLLADDKLTGIRILGSSDESLNIEIRYEGYKEEGKRYIASGSILDSRKQVMKEFTAEPQELSKNAEAVDLLFKVAENAESTSPYLDSKYIAIKVQTLESGSEESSDILEDLAKLFGGSESGGLEDMVSNATQFEYSKRWRVAGNANMVIQVTLTPIGKAINN